MALSFARDRRRYILFGPARRVAPATHRRRAEVLLDSLFTLGPTFIKLGQLLSTRPDVLPPEYVDVLSALQDRVPPAPWDEARDVVESELGPVDEQFDAFDTEAISGASLGQVYRAELDGRSVAVKVRRPAIERLVEADLRVIHWSLSVLGSVVDESRAFSLSNLAEEFEKTIYEEMDYEREAAMLTEIKGNLAGDDRYRIPGVIGSHSNSRVLTMEYVPGTKITDVERLDEKGIDRSQIAENLQRSYLQMVIDDGVFHADPHPGNLAVTDDGTIVFYDFGMSGRVDEFVRQKIVEFYVAVANQNIDAILDVLIEVGTLSPDADRAVMAEVIELAIADARGEEIEQYRVQQIVGQIESSMYEFPFRLPKNLALVLRVATVVEGVCVTLDSDFDFIAIATDYLTEQGYREESARRFVAATGEQIRESTGSLLRVPPKLERSLDRLEREDLAVRMRLEDDDNVLDTLARRLVYGMLLSTTIFTTGVLYAFGVPTGAAVTAVLSLVFAVTLYRSFRQPRGIRATPQFTRQNLRRRRGNE